MLIEALASSVRKFYDVDISFSTSRKKIYNLIKDSFSRADTTWVH